MRMQFKQLGHEAQVKKAPNYLYRSSVGSVAKRGLSNQGCMGTANCMVKTPAEHRILKHSYPSWATYTFASVQMYMVAPKKTRFVL